MQRPAPVACLLAKYGMAALPTLSDAELVALDTGVRTLEGEPRGRVIILRFPDEATARRWYESEEYQHILPLRLEATSDGWAGLVTGFGDWLAPELSNRADHSA